MSAAPVNLEEEAAGLRRAIDETAEGDGHIVTWRHRFQLL